MLRRTAGLGLALLLALAGCTAAVTPTPSDSPEESSAVASASPTAPGAAQLAVGDCTGDVDLSGASITDVPTVPCGEPHFYEVHALVPVTGDIYPGAETLASEAKTACSASFTSYVGVAQPYSRYGSAYLAADEAAWAAPENRVITCLVGSADGGLVGSAKGDTLVFPKKGQCTGPQDVAAQAVEVLECSKAHYYEVFATKQVDGKKAPTAAEEQKLFASVCQDGFKNFVGVDVGKSKYEVAYFLAGSDIWDKVADHRIVCSAGSPEGGIKGSLKGLKK
jgi:hypothetical protein